MNLLELPKEILKEICSFIGFSIDILRFARTCKLFLSIAFQVDRNLYLANEEPFIIIKYMLSKDLQHLRKLVFTANGLVTEEIDWIVDRLQILSTLHNLKALRLRFDVPNHNDPDSWKQVLSPDILQQMTWLESLQIQYPIVGDLTVFANHSKLTRLGLNSFVSDDVIGAPFNGGGFSALNQLRELSLPFDLTESSFDEVIQLTNLKTLFMNFTNIPVAAARKVTQMQSLESIDISSMSKAFHVDWKDIKKLTNLLALIDNVESISDEEYAELNQMTQLTSLILTSSGPGWLTVDKISNLTNLVKLELEVPFGMNHQDYSIFRKMTSLGLYSALYRENTFRLPQSLKSFERQMSTSDHLWAELIEIDSLETLTMRCEPEKDETSEMTPTAEQLMQISRLTNLESLEFISALPLGVGTSLQALPKLRNLRIGEFRTQNIEEITGLTQLCQLAITYSDETLNFADLRKRFPFILYRPQ